MTQNAWLAGHPYLRAVAEFQAQVENTTARLPMVPACVPNLPSYEYDFRAGVPLLRSSSCEVDLRPAEKALVLVLSNLAFTPPPARLTREIRGLQTEMCKERSASQGVGSWLLDPEGCPFTNSG